MIKYSLNINSDEIINKVNGLANDLKQDLSNAIESVAEYAYEDIKKQAKEHLGKKYHFFEENLHIDKVGDNWVITLEGPAVFLDQGRQRAFMEYLLKGKGKAVIPFRHSDSARGDSSPIKQEYAETIKRILKEKKIDMSKIETDSSGSPRIGVISSFNVKSSFPTPRASTPGLYGLSVVQTKNNKGQVSKSLITFRTITREHEAEGKWYHPAQTKMGSFEKASQKALEFWNKEVVPKILAKYGDVK